jgi:Hypoxia induced protein conserved region
MQTVLHYAVPVALAAVAFVLLLGLWNLMRGGSPNRSQKLMQLRILLQAIALFIVMTTIYYMSK